ncbi:hypothetical protein BN1051_03279 [Arthrobacter saudimassiliensis]|uniref:Uncharacterized protein n=1 Tax=Arthrobacter saudimassiliensis TaxID=1461584 RepID=A0A078MYK4_9MICC|nr:hypothetical protein BN1051_03279 [Arthrobacter saudimassiliensis]
MAVIIHLVEGADDDPVITLEEDKFSYFITEAGVLQLIRLEENGELTVEKEYSSAAWLHVKGTRYMDDTSNLDGEKGSFGRSDGFAHL